jgi:hypothetical protein
VARLRLAKVPARSAERDAQHPLVIAGGPIASINPEPLAPLVDLFLVGEAEPVLGALMQAIRERLGDRESLFAAAAQVPGVYVPSVGADTRVTQVRMTSTLSTTAILAGDRSTLFLVKVSRAAPALPVLRHILLLAAPLALGGAVMGSADRTGAPEYHRPGGGGGVGPSSVESAARIVGWARLRVIAARRLGVAARSPAAAGGARSHHRTRRAASGCAVSS